MTEHAATVFRVCRAILGSHADAEDAWSETFLAALRAYPRLDPSANVQAWLVTIAHRKAIDLARAQRRRALPVADFHEGGRPTDHRPEDDYALWDQLKQLPERQRHALAYHYLGGLPYAEVAVVLGCTPAAARKAGSDGIKRLRGVEDHGAVKPTHISHHTHPGPAAQLHNFRRAGEESP